MHIKYRVVINNMLNTSNWKPCKISDLFDVELSKGDLKQGEQNIGKIPLVSSGSRNNGVVDRIDAEGDGKSQIFPAGTITVDMFCKAYYQPVSYYAVSHGRVNILKPKFKLTPNIALFICCLINYEAYRFCYGRGVYSSVISDLEIKLPVDVFSKPDWVVIEQYMDALTVNLPKTNNTTKRYSQISISNWRTFKIGALFALKPGKVNSTDVLNEGNDIYYCGAKKDENGIISKCAYDREYVSKGNCIVFICDGQGAIGYNNYMDRDFIATVNLMLGYNAKLNKYNAMFIVSVLDLERPKFSFGRKRKKTLADTKIKLPAKKNSDNEYEPDWQYMEDYIKSLPYGDVL